jgi:hypothetical protein
MGLLPCAGCSVQRAAWCRRRPGAGHVRRAEGGLQFALCVWQVVLEGITCTCIEEQAGLHTSVSCLAVESFSDIGCLALLQTIIDANLG